MALTPGTRLGPYEVTTQIGVGGMGEVYRATDTNLARQVAIKVLPEAVAADPERLARFDREAKTLAALNHPNIAAIYGVERSAGMTALVMELVEGPTLADRIAQGAIPVDEALPIAKEIAEALEAAHEQGIIHRDLKPANVKVRPDGTVKVLDFGLAKATEPAGNALSPSLSQSPTITTPAMTQAGMILGTAAYMSPEQAKGRPADKRSDVWAFGCVLFEMLAGQRAFEGEDVSDTLASVLRAEPNWRAFPRSVPVSVQKLVEGCLAKDRRKRVSDLAVPLYVLSAGEETPAVVRSSRTPLALIAVTCLAIAAVGASGLALWRSVEAGPQSVVRSVVDGPDVPVRVSGGGREIAISPDGSIVAYIGGDNPGQRVYVRRLDELEPVLVFTGSPRDLFFSPDGAWIGFFDGGNNSILRRVSVNGGAAVNIADTEGTPRGAAWAEDGTIVFATNAPELGLQRVAASGGEPEALTKPAEGERDHWWPELLPGGRAVLFTVTRPGFGLGNQGTSVAVLDLDSGMQRELVPEASGARYLESGHLIYASEGDLWAVRFDVNRLETIGAAAPLLRDIAVSNLGAANVDVSRDGTLAYVRGGAAGGGVLRSLLWVDRGGNETPIEAPSRAYAEARLSPDDARVVLDVRDQENDIWLWDVMRETLSRLTFGPGLDRNPVWSPDGTQVAYTTGEPGEVAVRRADGAGAPIVLDTGRGVLRPKAIVPDGSSVVVWEQPAASGTDLLLLPLRGAGASPQVTPLLQSSFNEDNADLSPDGRWLAYQSDESGATEVYVRPFPDVDAGRWQISNGGGSRPVWSSTGAELFFLNSTGVITAVTIETTPAFVAGAPRPLHTKSYYPGPGGRTFDVTRDGKRFLVIQDNPRTEEDNTSARLVLVQNVFEELKRLVPTD